MSKRHLVPKWLASAVALLLVFGTVATSFPSQAAPASAPASGSAAAPAFGSFMSVFGSINALTAYAQQVGGGTKSAPASAPTVVDLSKFNVHPTNNTTAAGGRLTNGGFSPEGRTIDLNTLGKAAAPRKDAKEAADANKGVGEPAGAVAPNSGALGTANAFMSVSPEVISTSVTLGVATAASGFLPGEAIAYYQNGVLGGVFAANGTGQSALWVSSGTAPGVVNLKAVGLRSGKVAAGTLLINNFGIKQRGLAVAPHAIDPNTTDTLLLVTSNFTTSQVITISRNAAVIGTLTGGTNGAGSATFDPAAAPNGSAVYNASVSGQVGSAVGQSVEERADAGAPFAPQGDRNVSRTLVDRPVYNANTGTTGMGAVGEGFQAGEVVTITVIGFGSIGTATADANGSVGVVISGFGPGAGTNDFRYDGRNSGRQAWFTSLGSVDALDAPNTIVAPSSRANGTVTAVFDNFPVGSTGFVQVDGVNVVAATTNAQGFGFATFPVPPSGLIHSVAYNDTGGLVSPGPLVVSPFPPAILTGNVTDATSGAPIKATLALSDTSVQTQSDPQAGGVYTLTANAPGTYTVTVTASGCYVAQSVSINLVAGNNTRNFAMTRSAADAFGYSCFDNAARAYTPAANNVGFPATFDDENVNFVSPVALPFYGSTYFTGTIQGNGFATIGLNITSAAYGACIPNVAAPNSVAAASWDDLQGFGAGAGVFTDVQTIGGNPNFIIEWRSYRHFGDAAGITNTVQLQIDSVTGNIYVVQPTFNVGRSDGRENVVGIENQTGTIGKQHQCNLGTSSNQELTQYQWAGNSVAFVPGVPPTPTITPTQTSTPTLTPTPCAQTTLLNESFTTGLGTFANTTTGSGYWAPVVTNTRTLPFSAFSPDVNNVADEQLTLITPLAIPNGASTILSFYHYYGFEFFGTSYYDGGVLEFSTDGGTTWSNTTPNFISGGYGGTISTGFSNPLAGRAAWVSTVPTYTQVLVDLSGYAGQNLLFRFRQGDDSSTGALGWFVDDVTVTAGSACTATPATTATAPAATFTATPIAPTSTATPSGGTVTPTPCSGGNIPGPWTTGTTGPGARYRSGSASDGTYIYVFGGANGPTYLNDLWRYDPAAGTWLQLANMPTAKQNIQGTYYNGKIYVPGGFNGAHITENAIYDIAGNSWSTGAPLPATQTGTNVAYNGKIYDFGGNPGPQSITRIYDIAGNSWSTGASMPVATTYGRAIAVGNYAYYVGGIAASTTNAVYRYDFVADSWMTMAPLQTARTSEELMSSPDGSKIYAVNGGDATFFNGVPLAQTTEIYDIASNTWTYGPPTTQTTAGPAGGRAGNTLMIMGGTDQSVYYNTVQLSTLIGGSCGTVTSTPSGATPTTTSTPIAPTSTATAGATTATTTPAPCDQLGTWAAGPDLPAARIRGLSAYWPANGKYYILGGRTSDAAGSDVLNPTEYDPGTNTWTTKAATFPTNYVNNMAGGIITISGTQQIIAVGGSFAGGADAVGDVRLYNPATDSLTTLASDPWPGVGGANDTLPGGYAVWNNKLYIIGGFQINVQMVNTIYEFDPARADGARWQLKTATLPVQLGYVPAAAIGNYIYTAGGSTYDGAALADSDNSYRYDPAADSITTIANIPRATAETRALNYGGKMWVLGGGRIAPNPSNEVDVYDPGTDSWSLGPAFTTARRNLMADTDGNKIYLAGGYAPTTATASFEIYTPGSLPCTPTATPTSSGGTATSTATTVPATATGTVVGATATSTSVASTPTNTPAAPTTTPTATAVPPTGTATLCPNPFVDINGNVFYNAIMYLYCRGIVNGVDATHYSPAGTASRAQFAKVVVLGFAIPNYTPAGGTQDFTDVPITYYAYQYIEAGFHAGILSGYDAATCAAIGAAFPCYGPNRPITRAQLTKLVVRAGGFIPFTPTSPTFPDVGPSNVFYADIETAVHYGIINGYPDGLFRPNNNIRRDEMAQIVYKGITTPPVAPDRSAGSVNHNSDSAAGSPNNVNQ